MVRLQLDLRSEAGGQRLDAEAQISDLVAREPSRTFTLREPATLSAHVTRRGSDLRVEGLAVKTLFLDATGAGDLDRGVTLNATLDLAGLQGGLRDLIDFGGLEMAGKGRIAAEYRRAGPAFSGRFAAELQGLAHRGPARRAHPAQLVAARGRRRRPGRRVGTPPGLECRPDRPEVGRRRGHALGQVEGSVVSATADASGRIPVAGSRRSPTPGWWSAGTIASWRSTSRSSASSRPTPRRRTGRPARRPRPIRHRVGRARPDPPAECEAGTDRPGLRGLEGLGPGQVGRRDEGRRGPRGRPGRPRPGARGLEVGRADEPGRGRGRPDLGETRRGRPHGLRRQARVARRLPPLLRRTEAHEEGPIALAARGTYLADTQSLDLASFTLSSPYASLDASGDLQELGGSRLADLRGNLAPNWEKVNAIVATSVEPKARVKGQPRPFHVRGPLSGGSTAAILKGLDAEIGVDLTASMAFGMLVGPSPIVLKCGGGRVEIVPISTTLNGGKVDLKPEILLDETQGATLKMAAGSAIEKAEINDEVSTRVLSYIAPVLHKATQVRGFVSVQLDRAEVPLWGAGDRQPNVDGTITFHDVVYGPGTLAKQLLTLTGKGENLGLRLDQEVKIQVADGRVTQSGLAIDMGNDVKVDLAGSVGFDHTLKMRAAVPITGAMLGNQAALQEIVGGTRVGVPIGGTMTHPAIDQQALGSA